MLHLLQHRIGQAGDEGVTAQQQHGQTVGVGQGGGGQQIGGAGTRRGGAEHETLAQMLLGIGGSRKAHALFVLAAIDRQLVTVIV